MDQRIVVLSLIAMAALNPAALLTARVVRDQTRWTIGPAPVVVKKHADPVLDAGGARPPGQGEPVPVGLGTTIAPARELQNRLAKRLADVKTAPAPRLRHFAWCQPAGVVIVGWYGTIQDVTKTPGGWRVSIRISPHLRRPAGGVPFTRDRFVEIYDVTDDAVRLVRWIDPPDAIPGIPFID
jgi:hypothetical protein